MDMNEPLAWFVDEANSLEYRAELCLRKADIEKEKAEIFRTAATEIRVAISREQQKLAQGKLPSEVK